MSSDLESFRKKTFLFICFFFLMGFIGCSTRSSYTRYDAIPKGPSVQEDSVAKDEVPNPSDNVDVVDEKSQVDIAPAEKKLEQEMLDSALEFCQASNDFWERGDLDNALAALDQAYSIILKVDSGDDSEIMQQKEDLRFTISKRIIEVYSSRFTVANGNSNAIPLVMNSYVKRPLIYSKEKRRNFFWMPTVVQEDIALEF